MPVNWERALMKVKSRTRSGWLLRAGVLVLAALVCAGVVWVRALRESGAGMVVCLDPGHGGYDEGCSNGELKESEQTLALALAVRDAMEKRGITVVMTRADDTYVALDERAAIANEAGADYFISIHRNAVESGDASGIELWTSSSGSEVTYALAEALEQQLVDAGVSQSRGCRSGSQGDTSEDYAVCRLTQMPAVLIEMGFITSDEDNSLFEENQSAYAKAITKAVLEIWDTYGDG